MPDWNNIYDGVFDIDPEYQGSVCDCSSLLIWDVHPLSNMGETSVFTLTGAPGKGFRLVGTIEPGSPTDTNITLYVPDFDEVGLERVTFDIDVLLSHSSVKTEWGDPGNASTLALGSFSASVIIHDGTHDPTGYDMEIIKTISSNELAIRWWIFTFPAPPFDVDVLLTNLDYLVA